MKYLGYTLVKIDFLKDLKDFLKAFPGGVLFCRGIIQHGRVYFC